MKPLRIDPEKPFGMRECPGCAMDVPENNNRCPICGYDFPNPTPRQKHMKLWGAIIMLALFIFVMLRLF